jgi:hypothetical protein
MPIVYEALHTRFTQATEDITVQEVGDWLLARPPETRHHWYLVVSVATPGRQVVPRPGGGFEAVEVPPPGYAVLLPLKDLSTEGGEARTLRDVPDLLAPAVTIERLTLGTQRAIEEWVPVSPGRRLVVLEEGQVIGLLTDEKRAGGYGGFPTRLPGQEQKPFNLAKRRITYRCPIDGGIYDFAELIDPGTNRLICPNGHIIEE